jgi:hypothetical protein
MGECFLYANFDKREYFGVGALGGAAKAAGVGRNLEARALGLLVMARDRDAAPTNAEGSWAGDRIASIGEYLEAGALDSLSLTSSDQTPFSMIEDTYRNVVSAVVLMLMRRDGPEALCELAERRDDLFVLLGELALVHRISDVERALDHHFGDRWKKGYAAKRKTSRMEVPAP